MQLPIQPFDQLMFFQPFVIDLLKYLVVTLVPTVTEYVCLLL